MVSGRAPDCSVSPMRSHGSPTALGLNWSRIRERLPGSVSPLTGDRGHLTSAATEWVRIGAWGFRSEDRTARSRTGHWRLG